MTRSALLTTLLLAACTGGGAIGEGNIGGDDGAGSDSGSDDESWYGDEDRDGILDDDDPNPWGDDDNRARSDSLGGPARVVKISAYNDAGFEDVPSVREQNLGADCSTDFGAEGSLCDEGSTEHDPDAMTKANALAGASFVADGVTGVIVMDLRFNKEDSGVDVNEARIFQSFGDGKTTQVALFAHPKLEALPPDVDDPDWIELSGWQDVGAGSDGSGDGTVVGDPTVVPLTPSLTRFIRVDLRNDGSHGEDAYTQLGGIKLFAVDLSQ